MNTDYTIDKSIIQEIINKLQKEFPTAFFRAYWDNFDSSHIITVNNTDLYDSSKFLSFAYGLMFQYLNHLSFDLSFLSEEDIPNSYSDSEMIITVDYDDYSNFYKSLYNSLDQFPSNLMIFTNKNSQRNRIIAEMTRYEFAGLEHVNAKISNLQFQDQNKPVSQENFTQIVQSSNQPNSYSTKRKNYQNDKEDIWAA